MLKTVKKIPPGFDLYINKSPEYYGLVRNDVIALIPKGIKHILDIGCGEGYTALAAKNQLGADIAVGVEPYETAAAIARENLDRVLTADIEILDLDYPEGYFDCIICADVLEHTKDPWTVLKRLKYYLSDDGYLVASIPNLQHFEVVKKIITDKFEYEPAGILDKTHLRFFTLETIKNMFRETGYEINYIEKKLLAGWKLKLLNRLTFGLTTPFSVFQYLVLTTKAT